MINPPSISTNTNPCKNIKKKEKKKLKRSVFIKNIRNAVIFLLNKFRKNFNKNLSIHFYTFNLIPLLRIFETRSESVFAIQTRRSRSPFLELLSSFSFAELQFCRLKSDTNEWIFTVDARFPSYVPYLNRVIVASANNGVKRVSFEHARRHEECANRCSSRCRN